MFESNVESEQNFIGRLMRFRVSWKLLTLLVGGLFFVVVAIWFVLAPFLTLRNMRNAAHNRDASTFCSYIDFPKLRENLKDELNARMLFEMNKDEKLKSNPFAGLATMAGPAIVNNMVDGYITPAAIERMFRGEKPQQESQANLASQTFSKDFLSDESGEISSAYKNFSEFQVTFTPKTGAPMVLVFERRNLVTWQLIAMKFQ
jgi:hypothetical protein